MVILYRQSLLAVLQHQGLTLVVAAATLAATIWLYLVVPKGFLPQQDTGLISAVTEAAPDVSFTQMQERQAAVTAAIVHDWDVVGVGSLVGVSATNPTPNLGHLTVVLSPRSAGASTAAEVAARLQRAVAAIPGVTVYFQPVQDIQIGTRSSRTEYQYTLVDTDAAELAAWSTRLVERLRASPTMRDVASDLQQGGLQALIPVDREMASRLGVSMQAIDDTLYDAFGQRQISTIYAQANQYRVILEADPQYQRDPSALAKLYVKSQTGQEVPLGAFHTVQRMTASLSINHQAQFPAVTISFNLADGASLGEAVQAVSAAERAIGLPSTVVGSYSGDAAEFAKSLAGEPWLILAATVAIYIVLGVLYESFIHPLTILSTLPSAGVGALLALMLCGQDLSMVALIGIVLLMGIVKKNAIMMIDFALEAERKEGFSPSEAIVRACLLRFRPIMMTTAAALLGALPLALQRGTGSELRVPLGITIIGGLLLSQVLTLYTTPVIYLIMERVRQRLSRSPAHAEPPPAVVAKPSLSRSAAARHSAE
jgi:multidrug efflux pump